MKQSLLAGGACLAARPGAALSQDGPPPAGARLPADRARIVIARDARLRDAGGSPSPDRLLAMLDRAMQTLLDRDTAVEAWQRVVRPGEVVGLKVNCLSGRGNSTSVALVEAIGLRLQEAGIRERDIVVWDRLNEDLERGGFRVAERGRGVRCIGNDVHGYEPQLAVHGAIGSCLCRTLTQVCDCVINLPVLKDHSIAGVTVALKNLFGAIHNPNKYHLNVGDPFVADVNALPDVRGKMRLVICDATVMQYEGGPSYLPRWAWNYDGLIVGTDPVALDTIGWQLIEKKRAVEGMPALEALGRAPRYLVTASDPEHGLGIHDLERIERIAV